MAAPFKIVGIDHVVLQQQQIPRRSSDFTSMC